jgi:hypothetical protein
MQYSGYTYDIAGPDTANKFRWTIYTGVQHNPKVVGPLLQDSWEEANTACKREIGAGRLAAQIASGFVAEPR